MALGTPTDGGAAYSASGGTSVSPAYPASIAAGDCLVLIVGQKPSTANGGTVTTPSGWTLRESLTGAGGYGTTLGADTGNTNLFIYTKNTVAGTETGNLTVTVGTNNVCWGIIVRIPSGVGNFVYGTANGSRTTAPTSGTAFTTLLTNGTTAPDLQNGDMAIWAMCIPTDILNNGFTAPTISSTGTTFGTAVELEEPDSGTGNDIGGYVAYAEATAGSSTAAPTVGVTATGTVTNVRGPIALIRVREVPPDQTLTQNTTFTNTPEFFGPTATASNTLTPALFTNTPQFFGPTAQVTVNPGLYTNTPQFFAATATFPVTLSQVAFGSANLIRYSEQFDNGAWDRSSALTLATNVVTAPDGTLTADSITTNATTGSTYIRQAFSPARPLQIYTFSVYAKKNNYRYIGLRACNLGPGLGTSQEHSVFDFDTESFVYTPPTSGILSTSWTNVGDGWYRLVVTAQVAVNATFTFRVAGVAISNSVGTESAGAVPLGSSVYIWGAQLELAATASAYIQTVATAPIQVPVPNVFYAPTVAQTGGDQTLTPALYTNTPQFFAATLTSTRNLTPALYTNTPQFFAATLTSTRNLTAALYTNTPQFFAATLTSTRNLTAALYTNTPQFFGATLTSTRNLTAALYTNTPQFFGATVTAGPVALTQNTRFTNTPQFFGATIATSNTLTAALYTNTPQFFGATVAIVSQVKVYWLEIETQGSLPLFPSLYTNTPQFFAATVTVGPVTLTQNTRFTNTPQFFSAALGTTLTPALYTNAPQFFAPTVTATRNLTPALYTNTPQFFAATLTSTRNLTPALYTNTPQFFAATVGRGPVALTQNTRFTNTPQFFSATVSLGQNLAQNTRFTNTPQFFTATLTATRDLTPALFTNTPAFFTATATATYTLTQATRFTNTPQFYGGVIISGQQLTFEEYVVSGYVDPPGYVTYIAYFNNVFYTGDLALQVGVSGLQATGFVGTVATNLASVVVPTGVQTTGGVGYVNIWGLVDDSQTADWQAIDVAQDPNWVLVDSCTC